MRSDETVHDALSLLRRYRNDPRKKTIGRETKENLLGCELALEWILGDDRNPLADTLRDLPMILQGIDPDTQRN